MGLGARRQQARAEPHRAAGGREPAQIGLVQRRHIDVAAARLHDADGPVGPQARHLGRRVHWLQHDLAREPRQQRVAQGRILRPPDMQRTARRQEAAIVKSGIGRLQQRSRRGRQRLHRRTAIGFLPEGDGAAGGVIARLRLHLQDQDPRIRHEMRAQAGPRHAAAHDHDVEQGQIAVSSRKFSIRAKASSRTGSSSRNISCAASRP